MTPRPRPAPSWVRSAREPRSPTHRHLHALAAGDRRTWRGVKGNYGYVALSGSPTPEGCQDFTNTVYIMGRPVLGKGTGCKAPDGTWRITG